MLSDLLVMVDRRARAVSLREKTIINERHAVRMLEPVLTLGVRAASVPDTWIRYADRCIDDGLAASTIRQRIDCVAAVVAWVIHADIKFKPAAPGSLGRMLDAMRSAARSIGKRIKRHRALSKPGRVSINEYTDVVRDIESLREPYRSALRVMFCFGTRATETLSLTRNSMLAGGRLFIPDRCTKTHSDLLLPVPREYVALVSEWLGIIEDAGIKYNTLTTVVSRAGIKWRSHDLRKVFRTASAVRGEDYLAVELILNHAVKDVPAAYLQSPPYSAMRKALKNSIDDYLSVKVEK
ncbi:site-specific integrase [Citrobacter portucalensis]|uniref:tyrosine-type recombinase/integrase n=1 Tax=Citrobacter portucalensis TaxID=1639133 RepID=UPI002243423C|nr:tyrosine-type recombinase/integrase [Citrobacter portucalensis]MCW8354073.1 tyrosine-type recombinase/integrase [Citrobacter portucalensis]MCX9044610.1 tyrosine-type recombinase/integrase [Citrobacter portucalensis]